MATREEIHAGQAVYSPLVLHAYDWFVLGFSNHVLWRCPTRELLRLYDRSVTAQHLDVGVGTGFYLDKATWPTPSPAITLLDLNPHSLAAAAHRIRRYEPRTIVANVLDPLPALGRFDSVALCYLFHCLPGSMAEKAIVLDHLQLLMAPHARIFGATIVQGDAPRSRAAQGVMNLYNRKGVFANSRDTAQELEAQLRRRFSDVEIRMLGTVTIFEARGR